jgi:ectoine hydroxylase-related dioxygenase (phytanoyl-CoA dioxygenase family)
MTLHIPAEVEPIPRHMLHYRLLSHSIQPVERDIEVYASEEELHHLVEEGYLVRERLFQGEALERLRNALDEVALRETGGLHQVDGANNRQFGGVFLRYLADKHPAFLELVDFPPTVSVARAVLGPLVQIRTFGCRITVPGEPNQETHWHQHHQVASAPLPPWFVRPHGLDCLIYLDEIDDDNGPLCVRPGSHKEVVSSDLPADLYDDLPDQVVLRLPAGSVVMMHCMLWHRARPPKPERKNRRVLLLNYTPTWMKQAPYGVKPENGLTQPLLDSGDPELRELLGVGGYT